VTDTPPEEEREYRPRIKFANRHHDDPNGTVSIPEDAIGVRVQHDADAGLLGGDGGRFVVQYLEPVDQ
jgi:hypothetical protein